MTSSAPIPDSNLLGCLANSVSAHEETRVSAEKQLGVASTSAGFASQLLQIASMSGGEPATQMAAAIYLKNLINRMYDPYDETKPTISQEEKTYLKSVVVGSIVGASAHVRPQLFSVVHKMIRADFPKSWPGLVDELFPLITGQSNLESVEVALTIFEEIVNWHGGSTSNDQVRKTIHRSVFPSLLSILSAHHHAAMVECTAASMSICRLILKCFMCAIQFKFSESLLGDMAVFGAWCTEITKIIEAAPPPAILATAEEDAGTLPYWKIKKWAFRIHLKIFSRYGSPKSPSYNNPDNRDFSKFYMKNVALPVINVLLLQIQRNLEGGNPFSEKIFCFITDHMSIALQDKKAFKYLSEHSNGHCLMGLVSHFYFPRICFSPSDQECWESDPEEFVRSRMDRFEELYSWQSSAIGFCIDLVKFRKKTFFVPILHFINETLASASSGAPQRDGAIFLLGSLSKLIVASSFKTQVEGVIAKFVVPQLKSPQGFLRMRACWCLEQFDEVDLSEPVCLQCLESVLNLLNDPELPVKIAAVSALGALLDNKAAQTALPAHLPQVMESILRLANEIQLDSIAFTLELLVQMFADELAPFAAQLCHQLCSMVARNLEGYKNILDGFGMGGEDGEEEEYFGGGGGTDKMMALVGMFKAIETMVSSMGKTPQLIEQMEEIIMPLLGHCLERRLMDVYEEVFELIDTITFSRKSIGPALWKIVPLMFDVWREVGCDFIEDMQTSFDNLISYGHQTLLSTPSLMQAFISVIEQTMTDDNFMLHDRVHGCKLMESLLLNCQEGGALDDAIPTFISWVLPTLAAGKEENTLSVRVHYFEVLINCINYNPNKSLDLLTREGKLDLFMSLLLANAPAMTRVHDLRLLILTITQLFKRYPLGGQQQAPTAGGSPLSQHSAALLEILLNAIECLPKALKNKHEMEQAAPTSDDDEDHYNFDKDHGDDDDDDEGEGEDEEYKEEDFAASKEDWENEDFYSDSVFEDDVLEEELFFETPLDTLDFASMVKDTIAALSTQQPQEFGSLCSSLPAPKQQFLQSLMH